MTTATRGKCSERVCRRSQRRRPVCPRKTRAKLNYVALCATIPDEPPARNDPGATELPAPQKIPSAAAGLSHSKPSGWGYVSTPAI